ncbi:hypothetical protein AVEN_147832-1 [Araneus ventricosus]|uniref:Tc1-like transposase DDE domain-containing protein n=1 Tax=Araneus ventricosus TaxID=182803 RepID=A0A4Y2CR46_ARAVE|nr:hypothetical protein AVEN_147832-1 [Araneus ventricosus]
MFGSDVPIVLISTQEKGESLIRQDRDCRSRSGLLSRGVLFLDDNARPHTAKDTKEHIRRLGCERLDNPAYSPDLSKSDFHLFPALKSALSERHFRTCSSSWCSGWI